MQYRTNCKSCESCAMKYDCHPEPGATQTKCESRGCIWCVSQTPGHPWCLYGGTTGKRIYCHSIFHSNSAETYALFITSAAAVCTTCSNCNTKIDCHPEPFADEWSCEDRGCMWCPTAQSGVPFCVYPTLF